MAKKSELRFMTWKEARDAFKEDPVMLIPMGSMEVQGPETPVGDYLAAEAAAKAAAEKTGAICVPVVPFGNSEYFRSFPGTISVSTPTLTAWLSDICRSLIEHGITKILFINGHGGNDSIIEDVARSILREHNLVTGKVNIWRTMTDAMEMELYGDLYDGIGHGGGPVDGILNLLYPEAMRYDLVEEEERNFRFGEFELTGIGKTKVNGISANLYLNLEDISKEGNLGDAFATDIEKSKVIYKHMVDSIVEFIEKMQKTDMHYRK